ncbi:MAG: chromosome partitioning ATPase [Comamonadaceae bacterium CG_4_9_14_3_um_filter_60_33]|nr:MAG: protein tyrosine kinase [Comamonadaceae bacterium CG2_30_59_20]PIY28326.1 MAG: chromosome partitioning ATPase [Comamonadaceae bacterium CG_4_10_14_3_um_filter_60_42]PJB42566.1 MAG: chromosome partitioning ATPase [Comamonadaceae bacterium CG_4_9_14_3_um_filter_60_33]
MSSLIEQAAKRLEQLRQAGVDVPAMAPPDRTVAKTAATQSESRRVDIDLQTLAAMGIGVPGASRSQIADQYRVIKRPLIKNAMGRGASVIANGNLIMVTSALPGEGKTFTSINLALSIAAELDNSVLLVDADVARPSLMRALGLPTGSPGLLDLVLDDTKDLSSVLLKTNVEKLSILPSGTPHPRATELLASDAMVRLLEEIAARYPDRIIVFDSPPLLITTESRVLATHMGQIVMVVHAGKTLQSDVKRALSTIESCPVKLMLLNRSSSLFKGGYGYGYGYESGYGYGYGQEKAA